MVEGSSENSVEKSRTRDAAVGTGVRAGCSGQGNMSSSSLTGRVVCSTLELMHTQPPNMLPSSTITLAWKNNVRGEEWFTF